jgi:hypothetical protein
MKKLFSMMELLVFSLLLVGCGGDESTAPHTPQGPALIMFYTDN